MKKCCKTYDINIRVFFAPFLQLLFHIFLRFWLSHIIGKLVRCIFPIICKKIVHMNRIPDKKCQKADRILMKLDGLHFYFTSCLIKFPLIHRNYFSSRSVDDFPPSLWIIYCIYLKLLRMEPLHQFNTQFRICC